MATDLRVVAVGQLPTVLGDVRGNLALCRQAVADAKRGGAGLVVLPELALSGYLPLDLLERRALVAGCREASEVLATEAQGIIVVFGTPWLDGGLLRNAAVVAADGQIQAVRYKTLLPTYDVFDEERYFSPASSNPVVEVQGIRLSVTVCEDIWNVPGSDTAERYGIDPLAAHLGQVDLAVNLTASPFHAGKTHARLDVVRHQAARLGAPLVYANTVGGNDDILYDGNSLVVAADGTLVWQGASFEAETGLVDLRGTAQTERHESWGVEVHQALCMGIRDYLSRTGFSRALVGLSGGIDSAVVATLAVDALGPENVRGVGMPSAFSSEGSVTDARALAENLGIRFDLIDIKGIVAAFEEALGPAFEGRPRNVAEENLQSRARGTLLMGISNKFGDMLLTTGNKSELSVGYATLYGDMNGGLMVLGDVYKTEVYALADHLNAHGERIPTSTLTKPPSAELAPDQKDSDSLPPYDELDALLRDYIEGKQDPPDLVAAGHDPAVVERVIKMVVRNEFKRWQAAPVLRISTRAFGVGRRIPLAQRWTGL